MEKDMVFGNLLVDTLNLGPVSPFDVAAIFLAIGMAVILAPWTENYGDTLKSKELLTQFKCATVVIASVKMEELKNKGSSHWWWLDIHNKTNPNRSPWLQSTVSGTSSSRLLIYAKERVSSLSRY